MQYFLLFVAEFIFLFFLSRKLTRSVSLLIYTVTRSQRFAIRIFHFLFLPGVIIHELSHLLTAEVLFVHTRGMSLSPERNGEEVTMGGVEIEKTDPIRRAIIGFAPVIVGVLLISFFVFYFLSNNSPLSKTASYLLVFFIVFEIGNTMFSSKKDLEGTALLLFVLAAVAAGLYFLGFRVPNYFESQPFIEIILRGIKILAFPVFVDLFVILAARFLNKRY